MDKKTKACHEASVASLYKDEEVANTYIQRRFSFSWGRLLHNLQVRYINSVINKFQPKNIVEIAPGPARIATDLNGVRNGLMIEFSKEMISVATQRLKLAGLDTVWELQHGNAFDLENKQIQCDFVYTFRFLRHFRTEERIRLYHNIHSCLRPRGLFLFDVVNQRVREELDSKNQSKPKEELDVYDVAYSKDEFCREMEANGFNVLSMESVLSHFKQQSWVSYKMDHRIGNLSYLIILCMEKYRTQNPLEWIALCQKR